MGRKRAIQVQYPEFYKKNSILFTLQKTKTDLLAFEFGNNHNLSFLTTGVI